MAARLLDPPDPLAAAADPVEAARRHITRAALRERPDDTGDTGAAAATGGPVGSVGLELEFHLVDLHRPGRRPGWPEIRALAGQLGAMPAGSAVSVEPGGQLELSTVPHAGLAAAVRALRTDRAELRARLAAVGFGAAPLGADPARPVRRVNPSERYEAMERHFAALGCARPGREMMSATAALQVNLDAGPAAGWARRVERLHALGPVLIAASACSPYLAGRASGWASMRQQAWQGIDGGRSAPVPDGEPAEAWARYALAAPVMLVRDGERVTPVTRRVPFGAWLAGAGDLPRRARLADLDYHLTTLFPPVRPRGYLEIRCLDAVPDRWWPALAALTVTLADDERAADEAASACEPVRGAWLAAARDGLRDPRLARAVRACVAVAALRCDAELRPQVEALAELFERGRSPGEQLRGRIEASGPLAVLEQEARPGPSAEGDGDDGPG